MDAAKGSIGPWGDEVGGHVAREVAHGGGGNARGRRRTFLGESATSGATPAGAVVGIYEVGARARAPRPQAAAAGQERARAVGCNHSAGRRAGESCETLAVAVRPRGDRRLPARAGARRRAATGGRAIRSPPLEEAARACRRGTARPPSPARVTDVDARRPRGHAATAGRAAAERPPALDVLSAPAPLLPPPPAYVLVVFEDGGGGVAEAPRVGGSLPVDRDFSSEHMHPVTDGAAPSSRTADAAAAVGNRLRQPATVL